MLTLRLTVFPLVLPSMQIQYFVFLGSHSRQSLGNRGFGVLTNIYTVPRSLTNNDSVAFINGLFIKVAIIWLS